MQVNDDHLCRFSHLFSDTDEFVRLHGESAESNVGGIDPNTCELKEIIKRSTDKSEAKKQKHSLTSNEY
jgi:hypothetical protein